MKMNKEEIGELWDKITPKLYGYLINTLKDPVLADDILQSTWLKAIEAMPSFNDRGYGISAWLFSIARNEMRMHWRKSGREVSFDYDMHDKEGDSTDKHENKIFLDQVINKLPKEDQELLQLRFIADLSFMEMAKVLEVSPVTTRVKMHRALSRARLILKTQYYE